MEEVARYQCVYHRNSRDFKDKNKKANCWEKIGEKFNLSAAEAEVKFRNMRTAYGRYLKWLKTLPSGSGEMQCQGNFKIGWLKEEINLLAAKCPPRRLPYCSLRFSRQHNARVIVTVPLSEMYTTVGSAIACDRRRLYGNNSLCDRLWSAICDPRSSAIVCDHMETSLKRSKRTTANERMRNGYSSRSKRFQTLFERPRKNFERML